MNSVNETISIFKSASEYNDYNYYEKSYDTEFYKNVSIYAISLEKYKTIHKKEIEFITLSGDVKNVIGIGNTMIESKENFIIKMYQNIYDKIGGIHLISSDFTYHEKIMKQLYPSYTYVSINYIEDIILFPSNNLPTQ